VRVDNVTGQDMIDITNKTLGECFCERHYILQIKKKILEK